MLLHAGSWRRRVTSFAGDDLDRQVHRADGTAVLAEVDHDPAWPRRPPASRKLIACESPSRGTTIVACGSPSMVKFSVATQTITDSESVPSGQSRSRAVS